MIIIKFPLSLFSIPLCRSGIIELSTKAVLRGDRGIEMLKGNIARIVSACTT